MYPTPRAVPAILTAFLLCAMAPMPLLAAAVEYRIDPVHTRIVFRVDHAGYSRAMGTLSGIEGRLRFDADDPGRAELDVHIPIARLDLGDEGWNRALQRRSWFDSEHHPHARFVAERVEADADGRLQVHGQLSLRGRTRPVVLDAQLNAIKRHPLTLRRSIGFSARAQLRRSDFGMDAWAKLVGDEVELWIEVEAVRARSRSDGRADDEPRTREDHDADPQ